ncbi:unnamed protein product [Calypogeia fissa]
MSWETFEKHIQLKWKESQISGTHLKGATLYLHEIGAIIYLDQKESRDSGSKSRSVVVLHPEWFCRQVVGELLLPEEMLEEGCSLIVNVDGLIPTYRFQCYFQHLLVEGTQSDDIISMLERVGLCYRKGNDEIMVPALIQKDDYNLMTDWEGEGFHLVIGRSLATEDHERTAIPITLFRQLQVELAEDLNFGGRGDSEYRAGKSFSSLKVGELSVLIQFDADPSNPNDDRIDILVKTVDPSRNSSSQVQCVCEIMRKLQVLCCACCPGLLYDVKVIKPWSATEKTPKMSERRLMSLREMQALLVQDRQYSSWRVSGNAVELKLFLSDDEMKEVLEIKTRMKAGADEGADDADLIEGAVEEIELNDFYYSGFSDGSEDPDVWLDEIQVDVNSDVSSDVAEEIEEIDFAAELAAQRKDDIKRFQNSNALHLGMERASVEHQSNDHQGVTTGILHAELQELRVQISDLVVRDGSHTRSHLDKAVYSEGNAIRQRIDEGTKKLLFKIQAHYSFSIAEKERSVPRNQEGLKLSKNTVVNDWLKKVEPWVRWSMYVVTEVAKIALTVFLPGTAGAIPSLSTSTEGHDKAKDTAVTMLQEEDENIHHRNPSATEQFADVKERLVAEGHGNVRASDQLTDVRMKLIAEGVVSDLIRESGMGKFLKGTRLTRVFLKGRPQQDVGCSQQADSVLWICVDCLEKYGEDRATDITP